MIRKPFSRAFPQVSASQAAAVCYRLRGVALEFLLVNTSAGKWTFPKGRIEPDLTGSQSAQREAWEEAGVEGLIESAHFGFYVDTKRSPAHENGFREIVVAAYMLEVQNTFTPEENDRNPTWFTPEEAKKKLGERRAPKYSLKIATLVDAAVKRATGSTPRFSAREAASSRGLLARS